MNKKLLQTLNTALGRTKTTGVAPITIDALQKRLAEELDWLDACPGRVCLVVLLQELAAAMRHARVVVNPGYSYLPDSFLLYLTHVTRVNPVEWDLPFSRFTESVHDGAEIPFEAGSGCLEVARKLLSNRENEFIIETEPSLFEITFLDGELLKNVKLRITTYGVLDQFKQTIKDGWHPLDEATLRLFGRADTDGSIWFENDVMREWLFDFGPESMSDLVLLNAIYCPGRVPLFKDVLANKQKADQGLDHSDAGLCRILRESYGVPVYQEQSILMAGLHDGKEIPFKHDLALKGHFIGRTMLSVETLWHRRHKTSLR
jgi:hypothetical protein